MILNGIDFFKDIFENIPEGIMICDDSFRIIEVNNYLLQIMNFKIEELQGKSCSEFIVLNKNNCPICAGNTESGFIPEQLAHIADIKDNNGRNIPVRINHKSIDNYYISVITPLSEIAFLNQAHIDFVSTVSHELRTPLTSIKGFADTLLTAGDKLDKEQQMRFIGIIKNQIDRLARLVENLLTVSRLESKKDKSIYKAINFKDFIAGILRGIAPKAQEHEINTDITSGLPLIWADSDKFEQIMTNLIDNAVKYSKPGTTITIQAGFSSNNPDYVEIKVRDQGIGIPKDQLSKIFTKFSRIDNPLTRQVQGTGLGLYITKTLVESMGGKIAVDSGENGSVFIVRLPIATPEKHASQKLINEGK
ncbi:MAG: ATP-binding protein [Candidatus Gastranaerophilales bacterium]|nr:ATP-binding protein [Candidatus Gastranaerophilales bacterium]